MKKIYSQLFYVMLSLTIMVMLTACGREETPTLDTPPALSQYSASDQSDQSDLSNLYPLVVTDFRGTEIVIPAEPLRIISVAPSITEIIHALGVEDKLIGRSNFCDYPASVSEIEAIGSLMSPDIERIVELNPDAVFVSTHFVIDNIIALEELGITVLAFYQEENFEGTFSTIESIGQILNAQDISSRIIEDMRYTVDEVLRLVAGRERPTVYYVVGFGEFGDFTAGGNTFIGQMLEMAGGANIAVDVQGWSFNLESLLESDPDIIVISNQHDMRETFMESDGYRYLTAVSEGRVYEMDINKLERQGVRNAQGLRAIAEIFHPNAFQ